MAKKYAWTADVNATGSRHNERWHGTATGDDSSTPDQVWGQVNEAIKSSTPVRSTYRPYRIEVTEQAAKNDGKTRRG